MQTTITYNVPEEQLESILAMLGYIEGDKEAFMNESIYSVVIPAITDKFITIKQGELAKASSEMPAQVRGMVESMLTITTK